MRFSFIPMCLATNVELPVGLPIYEPPTGDSVQIAATQDTVLPEALVVNTATCLTDPRVVISKLNGMRGSMRALLAGRWPVVAGKLESYHESELVFSTESGVVKYFVSDNDFTDAHGTPAHREAYIVDAILERLPDFTPRILCVSSETVADTEREVYVQLSRSAGQGFVRYLTSNWGGNHVLRYYMNRAFGFRSIVNVGISLVRQIERLHTETNIVHGDIGIHSILLLPGDNAQLVGFSKAKFLESTLVHEWVPHGKSEFLPDLYAVFRVLRHMSNFGLVWFNPDQKFRNEVIEEAAGFVPNDHLDDFDESPAQTAALERARTVRAALDAASAVAAGPCPAGALPNYQAVVVALEAVLALLE